MRKVLSLLLCALLMMLVGCDAGSDGELAAQDNGTKELSAVDSPFDLRDEDGEVQFTLGDVGDVSVIEIDTGANAKGYGLQITWTKDGAGRFAKYAAKHLGETLDLFVDGKEMAGYKIPRMITGDTLIVGNFDSRNAAQAIVDGMKEVQPM